MIAGPSGMAAVRFGAMPIHEFMVSTMAYSTTTTTTMTTGSSSAGPVGIVRQEGFQLPSPVNTNASNSPSDPPPTSPPPDATPSSSSFMHNNNNLSYIHDAFRKFPSHHAHQNATPASAAIDIAEDFASLIDPHSHLCSSTQSHSPNTYEEQYRHNIFDVSAQPTTHHPSHPFALARPSSSATDMYPSQSDMPLQTHSGHFNTTVPPLNSSMRFDTHPDPPSHLSQYRHTPSPSHRSRPARVATVRRDRRASSISSHVGSTSPPPRPHAILIPGRGSAAMGGFFVPAAVHPGDYNLPTPESIPHSFGYGSHHNSHIPNGSHTHAQFGTYASPSSPYYTYNPVPPPRPGTPTSLGISPSDAEALGAIAITTGNVNGLNLSAVPIGTPCSIHPSSLPATVGAPLSGGPFPPASHPTTSGANGLAAAQKPPDSHPDTHLSEKRRKRRERRRDNINERIGELAGLIPGVLFECDTPIALSTALSPTPTASSPTGMPFGMAVGDDPFSISLLGDCGMHVLPSDGIDSLPDLPEESPGMGTLKKDPAEDGEEAGHGGLQGHVNGNGNTPTVNGNGHGSHSLPSCSANGTIPTNGTTSTANGEQITIKANKGMILRKSVEYIRYLQQLVFVQASRGRDLEERNRALEQELATLRGSLQPSVGESLGNGPAHGKHGCGSGNVNGRDGCEDGGLDDKYDWGGDMDVEDVQQRAVRPCHQRRGSRYKQLDQREGLACLQEVEPEHEEEEERRGRQRERGFPERTTGIGRSVSRLRGGMGIGIGVGAGGAMEI
ncbi:hypothetical protein EDC04DRAFT_2702299 [Pisolithus marmoratus]|nr:hypothetical protein EDC04DRAFT_2702299 [Pisolithus marmoratus]